MTESEPLINPLLRTHYRDSRFAPAAGEEVLPIRVIKLDERLGEFRDPPLTDGVGGGKGGDTGVGDTPADTASDSCDKAPISDISDSGDTPGDPNLGDTIPPGDATDPGPGDTSGRDGGDFSDGGGGGGGDSYYGW